MATGTILTLLSGVLFAGLTAAAPPAEIWPAPPSPVVNYKIQVRLDPAVRTLEGQTTMVWNNQTAVPTNEIHFHLYLNAFRNNRSTFMQEAGTSHRSSSLEEDQWGWIEIDSVQVDGGGDRAADLRFAHPDDGNLEDRTVVVLPLGRAVEPGDSVTLAMTFHARLPHAFARTGFKGNFFMVAQWFPKPGVFQGEDGWNCHQFHANSEFFADFAGFDVTMTVPQGYTVGATGREILPPRINGDGSVSHHFIQSSVHDFAWTADPDFVRVTRTFTGQVQARNPGSAKLEGAGPDSSPSAPLPPVEVTLLLQPEHAYQEDRVFRAVFSGLYHLGTWYGPYPYETLTVVDPQHGARGAGGMEYPTLITIGSRWPAPASLLSPEGVTIHEFGHQYWYGLAASNEFEEAWLDEGLNTYTTGRVLDREYGPRSVGSLAAGMPLRGRPLVAMAAPRTVQNRNSKPDPLKVHLPASPWPDAGSPIIPADGLLFHRLGLPADSLLKVFREVPFLTYLGEMPTPATEGYRPSYLSGPRKDALARKSWEYQDRSSYSLNSYRRPALVLTTLERLLGEDTMTRALRAYQWRYRYRHPTARDLENTIEEVADRDLDWLLRPLLRSAEILDYAVSKVEVEEIPDPAGVFGQGDEIRLRGSGRRLSGQPPHDETGVENETAAGEERKVLYRSVVEIRRLGAVAVPVAIDVEFEDGSVRRENWDGNYAWVRFTYEEEARVRRATVDPDRIYAIDLNWSNNSRQADPDRRPATRWSLQVLLWLQNYLSFFGGLA
jgi:hypothetical protein